MTHEEIENYQRELQSILDKYETKLENKGQTYTALRELARKVGASTEAVFLNVVQGGSRVVSQAEIPELAYNIHFALQTASMIDACRTAAENVEVAQQAQRDASKAQWVAIGSMVAAWAAVVVHIAVV